MTLDRVQRYGGLANPALPWPSLDEAVDDSAVGKLTRMTQQKFEEMDRLMVDMAIKLQVRSAATSATDKFSSLHGSQQRDVSKQDHGDHETDQEVAETVKESALDEGAGLNEKTEHELAQECTEEGETPTESASGIKRSNTRSPSAVQM